MSCPIQWLLILQLRFDGRSTAYHTSQCDSDVTHISGRRPADLFTYLGLSSAAHTQVVGL